VLDTHADRIRADRLRAFIEERKREADDERVDAIADDRPDAATERTGEIEAYEAVLDYVDAHSESSDALAEIRE
jgi:hypothetical protein